MNILKDPNPEYLVGSPAVLVEGVQRGHWKAELWQLEVSVGGYRECSLLPVFWPESVVKIYSSGSGKTTQNWVSFSFFLSFFFLSFFFLQQSTFWGQVEGQVKREEGEATPDPISILGPQHRFSPIHKKITKQKKRKNRQTIKNEKTRSGGRNRTNIKKETFSNEFISSFKGGKCLPPFLCEIKVQLCLK